MKSKDQLLLEQAYLQVYTNKSLGNLRRLIEADQKALDQLIEEGFGDFIRSVGSGIKGGAQKVASKIKETLTSGIATTLVKAIVSIIPKNELENFVNIIAKGQVPKDKALQVQQQVAQEPENIGGTAPVEESFYYDKAFFVDVLFNENNILEVLQNGAFVLNEIQSVGMPASTKYQAPRPGREIEKYAKEVAQKIQSIYKNKRAMASAIPKFTNSLNKYLGITPQTAATNSASAASANNSNASQTTATNSTNSNTSANSPAATNAGTGQKSAVTSAQASSGSGLVSKIRGFIKNNPVISAAAGACLLGLVVAAFAGSAPVVVPVLLTALKGAGWSAAGSAVAQKFKGVGGALMDGGIDAAKQQFKDNKIELKTTAKHAAIGAATAGISKLLMTGLGNIAGTFGGTTIQTNQPAGTEIQSNQQVNSGSRSSNQAAWDKYAREKIDRFNASRR